MSRRDRLIRERRHDPYEARGKLPEPTMCPTCRAVFRAGRWQWGEPVEGSNEQVCPACQRAADGMPAGILTLAGPFHREHRVEILGLVRHVEEREAKQHPLKRIMAVSEAGDELEVTTCEAHLARAIGAAIHHAYQGELELQYADGGGVLRVRWTR